MNLSLIAIFSAVFGAIATVMARSLLTNLKSRNILGINFFINGTTLLLVSPFFYFFKATFLSVGLIILISLIDTLANYFYFKTFEKTEASIAAPILSLAPGFTFFFGWLLLGDIVSLHTYFIAFLIIIFIIIFSVDFKNFHKFKSNTLFPALASSVLFGLSAIPSKFLLSNLAAINAPTLYMFRAGFIALFSLLFFGFSIVEITVKQFRVMFLRGLFVIAQWILLYLALSKGSAGIAVTLGNITPIFVFIFGIFLLHEKPTIKKIAASLFILVLSKII